MAANQTFTANVNIKADIADLVAKMSKVEGTTAATAQSMGIALEKQWQKVEKAAKANEKAVKAASKANADLQAKSAKAQESLSSMGSALNAIVPGLGAAVAGASALAGGFKGAVAAATALSPVLIALTAAVAVGATVYSKISGEMAREQQLMEASVGVHDRLAAMTRQLQDARLNLAEATGRVTTEEAKHLRVALLSQRAILDVGKAQRQRRRELQGVIDQTSTWTGRLLGNRVAQKVWIADVEVAKAELAELDEEVRESAEMQRELREIGEELAKVEGQKAAATGRSTDATEEAVDKEEALAEALERRARAAEALAGIGAGASADLLSEEEKVLAWRDEQLAKIDEQTEASAEERNAAALAVEERAARDIVRVREERAARESEIAKAQASEAKRLSDEETAKAIANAQAVSQAKIGFAVTTASSIQTLADLVARQDREHAMEAFRVGQAAALAEAIINTALAISEANTIPFPGNLFAMAAAGVAGATQAAAIASASPPAFYSGGMVTPGPDAIPAYLHPGEAVIPRSAVQKLGESGTRDLARGRSVGTTTVVETRLDGRVLAASMARQARRSGALADELTRRTGRLGHWS